MNPIYIEGKLSFGKVKALVERLRVETKPPPTYVKLISCQRNFNKEQTI